MYLIYIQTALKAVEELDSKKIYSRNIHASISTFFDYADLNRGLRDKRKEKVNKYNSFHIMARRLEVLII